MREFDESVLWAGMQMGKRVRFEGFKKKVRLQLGSDANVPVERVQITGGLLAKAAKIRFVGSQGIANASAKQVFEYLRNDGDWRQIQVVSPRGGMELIPI